MTEEEAEEEEEEEEEETLAASIGLRQLLLASPKSEGSVMVVRSRRQLLSPTPAVGTCLFRCQFFSKFMLPNHLKNYRKLDCQT